MTYRAKKVYQDKSVVEHYDDERFKTLKGRLTNWLELRLIYKALRYAGVLPSARILDIPCGTGRLSFYLSKKGYLVTGGDISSEMIKYTNEHLRNNCLNDKSIAKIEDAEKLSFPDNSFDVSITLRLLGHTPPKNRLQILKELRRVSQKYLILVYYDKKSFRNILRKKQREGIGWNPVTISEIDSELDKINLKRHKVYYLLRGFSETMLVIVKK